jgi:uncharacterized protein YjiS (DUF1127 family)
MGAMQKLHLQNLRYSSYLLVNGRCRSKQISNSKENKVNLIRSYNNWRRYRETVAELGRLTSRELNDLGINRGDIPFVAMKSAAR